MEIISGSMGVSWGVFIFFGMLWLGLGGGIIAQTRSIGCEKIEPTVVNCQITDSVFWGAIRRVKIANGVQRAFVDEEIGYSDASQYPIYRVFFEVNNAIEIPVTDWERSLQFTNQVKNSLEGFLNSEAITYNLDLNSSRNVWGAIVSFGLITLSFLWLFVAPYRVCLILNKAMNQALIIQNFVLSTRKQTLSLNLVSLQFKEDTDSDDDIYYIVILATPGLGTQSYTLNKGYERQEVEDYWQLNPDVQLLKGFVRSEELLPPKDS